MKAMDEGIDLTDHMNDAVKNLKIVIAADELIHTGNVVALCSIHAALFVLRRTSCRQRKTVRRLRTCAPLLLSSGSRVVPKRHTCAS